MRCVFAGGEALTNRKRQELAGSILSELCTQLPAIRLSSVHCSQAQLRPQNTVVAGKLATQRLEPASGVAHNTQTRPARVAYYNFFSLTLMSAAGVSSICCSQRLSPVSQHGWPYRSYLGGVIFLRSPAPYCRFLPVTRMIPYIPRCMTTVLMVQYPMSFAVPISRFTVSPPSKP